MISYGIRMVPARTPHGAGDLDERHVGTDFFNKSISRSGNKKKSSCTVPAFFYIPALT
jgi:hypothetical protein